MKSIMQWLTKPPVDGPKSVLLLRLMVGGVFFWEGVLKFVYVNQGVGRFTKLGMPFTAFTADFVGCFEIGGGLLLLLGLFTRLITIPFVIEMIVAMLFEIARVFVCVDHVASFIVNPNHSTLGAAEKLYIVECIADCVWAPIP